MVQRGLDMTSRPGSCRKLDRNTTELALAQETLGRVSEALHLSQITTCSPVHDKTFPAKATNKFSITRNQRAKLIKQLC